MLEIKETEEIKLKVVSHLVSREDKKEIYRGGIVYTTTIRIHASSLKNGFEVRSKIDIL